jgi:hypothetical protein
MKAHREAKRMRKQKEREQSEAGKDYWAPLFSSGHQLSYDFHLKRTPGAEITHLTPGAEITHLWGAALPEGITRMELSRNMKTGERRYVWRCKGKTHSYVFPADCTIEEEVATITAVSRFG